MFWNNLLRARRWEPQQLAQQIQHWMAVKYVDIESENRSHCNFVSIDQNTSSTCINTQGGFRMDLYLYFRGSQGYMRSDVQKKGRRTQPVECRSDGCSQMVFTVKETALSVRQEFPCMSKWETLLCYQFVWLGLGNISTAEIPQFTEVVYSPCHLIGLHSGRGTPCTNMRHCA